jgi:hypothetical protein
LEQAVHLEPAFSAGGHNRVEAVAEQERPAPNTANVRQYQSRGGVSRNIEQEITSDLGAFVRAEPAAAIFKSGGAPDLWRAAPDDRLGSIAAETRCPRYVRLYSNTDHEADAVTP